MDNVVIKSSTKLSIPSNEMLEKAGWSILASSDPSVSEVPLTNTGQRASDRPTDPKVLEDFGSPVTSSVSEEPDSGDTESLILAALKVAEIEEELGLTDDWSGDKIARISQLENSSLDRLEERFATLSSVKSAGMARKTEARTSSLRLASLVRESQSAKSVDISDEAILL